MTTPGFISGDEYTDPGELVNESFSQSNAQLRELVAKNKEREEEAERLAAEEAKAIEEMEEAE
jgi:hypothetical protein